LQKYLVNTLYELPIKPVSMDYDHTTM